eukprot:Phypoly_transcript_07219.p1 GENE.Phypoly_transcript_07219~~Phypoly_transcript_07219.p1  ORF type:complete len:478 (+),score=82.03 Phypoly_transcript_07219:52-1434(+)
MDGKRDYWVRTASEEQTLLEEADTLGRQYLSSISSRPVFPSPSTLLALSHFDEPFPSTGLSPNDTLSLLHQFGSPATAANNGPMYFGFVLGSSLPCAAAAERLVLAWDQSAACFSASPISDKLEKIAGKWVLDALSLPPECAVGFGTSASACTLVALAAARRELLARQGWDFDNQGLIGAPEIKVVISELTHITVKKALRVLGFGMARLLVVPVDAHGRMDATQLPRLDASTIVCLQAGELNTGEFDPFADIIPVAKKAGAWVHVDGAFGLWARASSKVELTTGIQEADSWTTDGHKWLNTPYDSAMVICRHPHVLIGAMNSDAPYMTGNEDAQKNLTLEFSRRPRGISIWAALRVLGRDGVKELVETTCSLAYKIGEGLRKIEGYEVLNRVVINQVLFRCATDEETQRILTEAQGCGKTWFSGTRWQGRPAMRISVSSWRTRESDADELLALLASFVRK